MNFLVSFLDGFSAEKKKGREEVGKIDKRFFVRVSPLPLTLIIISMGPLAELPYLVIRFSAFPSSLFVEGEVK